MIWCDIRRLAIVEAQTPMNRSVSEGVGAGIDNGRKLVTVSCWFLSSGELRHSKEGGSMRRSCTIVP